MRSFRKILSLICVIVSLLSLSSCAITDAIDKLPFFEDNTTISEAILDSQSIMLALDEANVAMDTGNTALYGDKVFSESISFKDVIDKNDLKSAAETKRYKSTAYHLYWDNYSHSPFWSTDGSDDIRNADGEMNIEHKDTIRIINNTPVNELK